jgi:hypothetical protein
VDATVWHLDSAPPPSPLWPPSLSMRRTVWLPHPSSTICHGDSPEYLSVRCPLPVIWPDVAPPQSRQDSADLLTPAHRESVLWLDASFPHQLHANPKEATAMGQNWNPRFLLIWYSPQLTEQLFDVLFVQIHALVCMILPPPPDFL